MPISSVEETHNPLIPSGYDILWSAGVVLFLAAIAVTVWLILREIRRGRHRD